MQDSRSDNTPGALRVSGNMLYFVATTSASGHELWQSDGTEVGTKMVKDINEGIESGVSVD